MNIVIITIFNEMNYGAYLQAFALGEYLKSKGHTVSYYENSRWTSRDSFHALHLRDLKHLGFNLSLLRAYKKDWMRITKTNTFDGFDLAIIGSDELWNVRNVNFSHDRYLLGEGVDSRRTITYAVSSNRVFECVCRGERVRLFGRNLRSRCRYGWIGEGFNRGGA